MNGSIEPIYDLQESSSDTSISAYTRRWIALRRSCTSVFSNMPNLDIHFFRHASEGKCVRLMREMLRRHISFKSTVAGLPRCCLSRSFCSIYLIYCGSWRLRFETST